MQSQNSNFRLLYQSELHLKKEDETLVGEFSDGLSATFSVCQMRNSVRKINVEIIDIKTKSITASSWGIVLTSDNYIANLGTGLNEIQQYHTFHCPAVRLSDSEALKVNRDLEGTSRNRFFGDRTVRKYRELIRRDQYLL